LDPTSEKKPDLALNGQSQEIVDEIKPLHIGLGLIPYQDRYEFLNCLIGPLIPTVFEVAFTF
jgi:hypothetical protein